MSYFGNHAYEPRWLCGRNAVAVAHGRRLQSLLTDSWLVWTPTATRGSPTRRLPGAADFDFEQPEINHRKFDQNAIDPGERIA